MCVKRVNKDVAGKMFLLNKIEHSAIFAGNYAMCCSFGITIYQCWSESGLGLGLIPVDSDSDSGSAGLGLAPLDSDSEPLDSDSANWTRTRTHIHESGLAPTLL